MKPSSMSILFFFTSLCSLSTLTNSQTDSCTSNLNLNGVAFDTANLHCLPVWTPRNFVLRYGQASSDTWSFVLSAPDSNSYVAIGFSSNGQMVGSSAIVGWISNGAGAMKQYYLGGQSSSLVQPDQGNLSILSNSTIIVSQSSRIYMAFQLNTNQPQTQVLYAVGTTGSLPAAPSYMLTEHGDKVSTSLNYATGQVTRTGRPHSRLRRSHGILNMLGWGIAMLIGVIVARYFREWDPIWFYVHAGVQVSGFILGIIGVICGFALENRLTGVDVSTHKSIGIFVLVLGCLQVMAFFARPDKLSRVRVYWNWYHYSLGRILLVFAVANVFYGIDLGEKGSGWNVGYGIVVGILFLVALVLEIRLWMRK
ncbi:hypothetical protein HS088_TW10G00335 [Tripterygium wilfordii]|uniref:Cytochrome b561 and DOMON domain-containing protein n=1 Tax=Tripterygium wilfordii TaxID=458696 RepID=A0A7J7D4Z0_TRIWF|nr:cytochrome b561 and DOMON domain-containing protein At3g07570-like [Tripterygium wilfordii]KAF5741339.1 hypothetical protein HS088_TW10G00335 [Tripterygium wilfordii]